MGVNKVIYNGRTLIDTSQTTVTPESLLKGYTAINAAGNTIEGVLQLKQSSQRKAFTSNATTLGITISGYSASEGITEVYKNGFRLDSSEYSISGTTITFNSAVEAGSTVEVVYTYTGV